MTQVTQKRHGAVDLLRKSAEFEKQTRFNERKQTKCQDGAKKCKHATRSLWKKLCKRCRGKVLRRKTNVLLQNAFCQSRRLIFFWKNLLGITPIRIKNVSKSSQLSSCALLSPSEAAIAALDRSERPCACARTLIRYMHVVNFPVCRERRWVCVAP